MYVGAYQLHNYDMRLAYVAQTPNWLQLFASCLFTSKKSCSTVVSVGNMYVWGDGWFFVFCPSPLLPIPPLEIIVVGADGGLVSCWMGSEFVDEMLKSHKYFNVLSLIESAPPCQKIRPNWHGTPYCCWDAIMFACCLLFHPSPLLPIPLL